MIDYKIYKSELIINNQQEMIDAIDMAYNIHQSIFNKMDSTWSYANYNFFALSAPSLIFSKLFFELKDVINDYIPNKTKWMQCWLNYHSSDKVLDWHDHVFPFHGYISIDPKNTTTLFEDYEIKNEVGNIYIGPGYRKHKVIVNSDYSSPRITLGFDIQVHEDKMILPDQMLSFIPI